MYNSYPSDFTTYEQVNEQLKPNNNVDLSNDQAVILSYIRDASNMVNEWCKRTFVPYVKSDAKAHYELSPYRVQELPDDTLSLTTLTDTAGATVTASTYRLRDIYNGLNGYPYRYIAFSNTANFATTDSDGFRPAFTVDGIFGYSNQAYANAWQATTTLDGALSDTTGTSVTVTSSAGIEIPHYIRVGTEFMRVTAIASNTLTVDRGVNGSTATTHDNEAQVDVWQVVEPVRLACTRLSAWLYMSRQDEFQSVTFQDGTVATVSFPNLVKKALKPYYKPIYESVH